MAWNEAKMVGLGMRLPTPSATFSTSLYITLLWSLLHCNYSFTLLSPNGHIHCYHFPFWHTSPSPQQCE